MSGKKGMKSLVIWDEDILEKPESLQAERLCAVRSSKSLRLRRSKPGYFNPLGGHPGFRLQEGAVCLHRKLLTFQN